MQMHFETPSLPGLANTNLERVHYLMLSKKGRKSINQLQYTFDLTAQQRILLCPDNCPLYMIWFLSVY